MKPFAQSALHAYDTEAMATRATHRCSFDLVFASKMAQLDVLVKNSWISFVCVTSIARGDQLAKPHRSGSFTSDQNKVLNLCAYKKLKGGLAEGDIYRRVHNLPSY